jgi:hypothetical protein
MAFAQAQLRMRIAPRLPVATRWGRALAALVPWLHARPLALAGAVLTGILADMGGRGAGAVNLMILDACRNNPFTRAKGLGEKGLARVEAPESTLILYAAKPGQTASDNPGGANGLFTILVSAFVETAAGPGGPAVPPGTG